ncbi:tetratricopeptide repeat protein [Kitasatospora sp. NPDC057940]|uniref:tetratricopeptide repeat protein n=1 Tax=Kitasatospora sp. NPDC057940 TaxID=3346285 RepID=UPI0036DF3F06
MRHVWLEAPLPRDRCAAAAGADGLLGSFDCRVWQRGPYGGVGEFVRRLVLDQGQSPLVVRHQVELICAVRDLRPAMPWATEAVAALDVADVQIRFHSARRTRHLAYGIAEFVAAWSEGRRSPAAVVLDRVDQADATTVELVDTLLRRVDPSRLRLYVGGASLPAALEEAVAEYARPLTVAPSRPATEHATALHDPSPLHDPATVHDATAHHDPAWHDERADELAATGEWSWQLGAIPYHRERGTRPAADGVEALRTALGLALHSGFYEHAVRLAGRGLPLVTPAGDTRNWWAFTTMLATALTALDRPAEALALYDHARQVTDEPRIHLSAAYSTAMLHARHLPAPARDLTAARTWLDRALTLAGQLDDPRERTVTTVFHRQGLALLDSRAGDHRAALRTVEDGIAKLAEALAPGERPQDRARLVHNRAQLHLALGDPARALADLDTVIAQDPQNAEYYVDRAALHRATGRPDDAIADYDTAIRLGPHLPEAYYNRAETHTDLGRPDAALADLDRTLRIAPDHLDALVNRAGLYLDDGELDLAERDARAGLGLSPGQPHLLCVLGLVESERGRLPEAEALLTRAVELAPDLPTAWANRATIRFERGDTAGAIADLDRAITLGPDPVALYNRGLAHRELGNRAAAVEDFTRALAADPGPDLELRAELLRDLASCTSPAPGSPLPAPGPAQGDPPCH